MRKREKKTAWEAFLELSPKTQLWIVIGVVAIVLMWTLVGESNDSQGDDTTRTTASAFVPVNRLPDYQDAYGGDVSGTPAAQVLRITEESWGLHVQVSPADPELAEWACGNVKSLLGFGRVEVWSGQTVLETC